MNPRFSDDQNLLRYQPRSKIDGLPHLGFSGSGGSALLRSAGTRRGWKSLLAPPSAESLLILRAAVGPREVDSRDSSPTRADRCLRRPADRFDHRRRTPTMALNRRNGVRDAEVKQGRAAVSLRARGRGLRSSHPPDSWGAFGPRQIPKCSKPATNVQRSSPS